MDCEAGERSLSPQPVIAEELSTRLKSLYTSSANKKQCLFIVVWEPGAVHLVTDLTLLLRVLGNLITNAIEASEAGARVTVTVQPKEHETAFLIHNEGVIPELTAAQLFKTRLSTKGPGRGLGMYSVQVFGEQYLGGHVDFESSREDGTVFRFTLPNTPPSRAS
jgi:signal transduction histidine kinase